ncbi:MAG: hypothetical protein AAGA18_11745 [Verrucomicrobiota bacterium]
MPTSTGEQRAKVEDLNSLLNSNFGPDWASGSESKNLVKPGTDSPDYPQQEKSSERRPKQDLPQSKTLGPKDRRSHGLRETRKRTGPPTNRLEERRGNDQRTHRGGFQKRQNYSKPFDPVVEVAFQPKEEMFRALIKIMRDSCRTFELFSVARTMLQKAERYQIIIRPLKDDQEPNNKQKIYLSIPDKLLFLSESEVVDHIIANHLERFFDLETVDTEPPKGNFVCVNKCGITGELLGPPNYHRYKDTLREHFSRRINQTSYERFTSKIVTLKDEESIQSWLKEMSKTTKYKVKTSTVEGEERRILDSREQVIKYLLGEAKGKAVKEVNQGRLDGEKFSLLPKGDLSLSIVTVLEQQKRFPLNTANILRDRFRHQRFSIYKKGSKGVSYVCAIKRKHRTPDTVFAASMQNLIAFIENNPRTLRSALPEKYLEKTTDSAVAEEQTSTMLRDLHWLISEGYVSEFEDGALFISPVQSQPQQTDLHKKKNVTVGSEKVSTSSKTCSPETKSSVAKDEHTETTSEPLSLIDEKDQKEKEKPSERALANTENPSKANSSPPKVEVEAIEETAASEKTQEKRPNLSSQ